MFHAYREETFNSFGDKLDPKTVVHNWYLLTFCLIYDMGKVLLASIAQWLPVSHDARPGVYSCSEHEGA